MPRSASALTWPRARTSNRSTTTLPTRSSRRTRTRRAEAPPVASGVAGAAAVRVTAFPPILRGKPRLLILGSLPGVASLAAGEYYAHPRNLFWDLMGELFGAGRELGYEARCRRLTDAGVAVWDVLHQAVRPGSLDSDIDPDTLEPNDFAAFFRAHTTLRAIAFNGGTSHALYRQRVLPALPAGLSPPRLIVLPSTSPAHAGRNRTEKLALWRVLAGLAGAE